MISTITKKRKLEPSNDQTEEQIETNKQVNQANGDHGEDEPIQDLLEPFSKEQLLDILKQAAENHPDVANRIREVADEDPSHRKIFVHGLGWDTKTETLIEAFNQYGEIEDCKAVFDKVSGKSKGYGFILFKSRSGARNALKQPQKKIGSRTTLCQLACKGPVFGGNAVEGLSVEHTRRKIYVSNVGVELDPERLRKVRWVLISLLGGLKGSVFLFISLLRAPRGLCRSRIRRLRGMFCIVRRLLMVPNRGSSSSLTLPITTILVTVHLVVLWLVTNLGWVLQRKGWTLPLDRL